MEANWAAAEARAAAGLQLRPVLATLPLGNAGWVAMLGEPTPGVVREIQAAATTLRRAVALLGGWAVATRWAREKRRSSHGWRCGT